MPNHKWTIEIPIYEYTLVVYTGDDVLSAITHYKLESYIDDHTLDAIYSDKVGGLAVSTKDELAIIVPLDVPASVLAHEATHIINFIFDEIGYETRPDNDESFTYFLTWLLDQIEDKLATKRTTTSAKKKKNKPSKQRVRNH